MHLNEIAKLLRITGDENRLKILCIVFSTKNACVSDIAQKLGQSIAVTSHHLQVLAEEGLLFPVRNGKKICYQLSDDQVVIDLKKFICKYK